MGIAFDIMVVQELRQGHVGNGLLRSRLEHHSYTAFRLLKPCFKDLDGSRPQRNAMDNLGLHPLCRHRPDSLGEVDLLPFHVPKLTRAAGGQDDKL